MTRRRLQRIRRLRNKAIRAMAQTPIEFGGEVWKFPAWVWRYEFLRLEKSGGL